MKKTDAPLTFKGRRVVRKGVSYRGVPDTICAIETKLLSSEMASLLDSWLLDLDIRQCSPLTLSSRKERVGRLVWFLPHKGYKECGPAEVKAFFSYLNHSHTEPGGRWGNPTQTKPLSSGRVKSYFSSLRAFFNWCVREEHCAVSPLDKIPAPIDRPDQIQPFTVEQIDLLFTAAKKSHNPKRNEAILSLLLDTGVRASELCALTVADLDLSSAKVTVREGKGGKSRQVPFSQETRRTLYNYLRECGGVARDPLFASDRGTRAGKALTGHSLMQLIRRLADSVGATGARYSPHTFRHTFAIMFLRNGGNPFTLQTMLGHGDMQMTRRYAAISQADVERQHREFSPVANLKKWRGKG